jgi:hypothetical protein
MARKKKRRTSDSGRGAHTPPKYMLVRQGFVQRLIVTRDGQEVLVWPVTQTLADAKRLCEQLQRPGVRPAEIGSAPGETLEGHIAMALEEGCVAACCVMGWQEDGSPEWGWKLFK